MQIKATILRQSHVYRGWRGLGRIGGTLDGVYFSIEGIDYVAHDVSPDRLYALMDNSAVQLDIKTESVGAVSSVPDDLDDTLDEPETTITVSKPSIPPAYVNSMPRRRGRPPGPSKTQAV